MWCLFTLISDGRGGGPMCPPYFKLMKTTVFKLTKQNFSKTFHIQHFWQNSILMKKNNIPTNLNLQLCFRARKMAINQLQYLIGYIFQNTVILQDEQQLRDHSRQDIMLITSRIMKGSYIERRRHFFRIRIHAVFRGSDGSVSTSP